MTLTQTVEIPANRQLNLNLEVPREVPTGRANIIIQFPIQQEAALIKKVPVFGCAKGQFRISADFNEPLEDFKDYM